MGKEGTVGWEEGDIAEDRDEDSAAPPGPANLRLHSGSSTAEFITSSHHVFFFFFSFKQVTRWHCTDAP